MAKYIVFFSYSPDALAALMDNPGDRMGAARALTDALGGSVEADYWMLGEWDGFVILDAPSSIQAAAFSAVVGSTGRFARVETHELLRQDQFTEVLAHAKTTKGAYLPPGQ